MGEKGRKNVKKPKQNKVNKHEALMKSAETKAKK